VPFKKAIKIEAWAHAPFGGQEQGLPASSFVLVGRAKTGKGSCLRMGRQIRRGIPSFFHPHDPPSLSRSVAGGCSVAGRP
jgi:hypothetical protein